MLPSMIHKNNHSYSHKTMSDEIQSRIEALFGAYRESLPGLLAELDSAWISLSAQWDDAIAKDFDRKVHGIAGSAPTFDLVDVGDAAKKLELAFKPLVTKKSSFDEVLFNDTHQLFLELKETISSKVN